MNFTQEQLERYSRHIILKDVGVQGQRKIMKGKALLVGLGGIGAPAALYLTAAGVGTIGLADGDVVDRSNLQRQVIHFTPDVGEAKVFSAKAKMEKINPDVKVVTHEKKLLANNIRDIIKHYDIVIDGTDNFPAKFLINDACVLEKKPFSHGGMLRFEGQTMTYVPGHACYRCVFRSSPPKDAVPSCSQAGVIGALAGMLGTVQAAEVVKFLIGKGTLLTNSLLTFDALNMDFRKVKVKKDKDCPVCGENPRIKELFDEEQPVCDLTKKEDHVDTTPGNS